MYIKEHLKKKPTPLVYKTPAINNKAILTNRTKGFENLYSHNRNYREKPYNFNTITQLHSYKDKSKFTKTSIDSQVVNNNSSLSCSTVQRKYMDDSNKQIVDDAVTDFREFKNETEDKLDQVVTYGDYLKTTDITYVDKKGEGMNQWVISATNAARRYFAEFDTGAQHGGIDLQHPVTGNLKRIPGKHVSFGISDDIDPDLTIDKPGNMAAYESKAIDSADDAKVNGHIKYALEQLDKRKTAPDLGNKNYGQWVATITIANPKNPYPWTPLEYSNLNQSTINTANIGHRIDSKISHINPNRPNGTTATIKIKRTKRSKSKWNGVTEVEGTK